MKHSKRVPLIMLGTLSLLTACGNNGSTATQNTYASMKDCQTDWGDDDRNCHPSGSGGTYVGPRYYWNHAGGYPIVIDPNGQTRPVTDSAFARSGRSTAIAMKTSVVRGGFGGVARAFSRSGGG